MNALDLCILWGQTRWAEIPPTKEEWRTYWEMVLKADKADLEIKKLDNISPEKREWLAKETWVILMNEINF